MTSIATISFRPVPRRRRAFSVVEILIVIGVVILLLSILIVAVNKSVQTSQKANTQFLMASMSQGLVQFKEDVGYLPPVLSPADPLNPVLPDDFRALKDPPDPFGGAYCNDVQDWYSVTALAEYLIGYADHNEDGYGFVSGVATNFDWDQENPPMGIRSPGRDGVWGATQNGARTGAVSDRMLQGTTRGSETGPLGVDKGQVLGPYLELKDEGLIGSINGDRDGAGRLIVSFPGDGGYSETDPKVIVDYWGSPIRYYRRPYVRGALKQSYRTGQMDGATGTCLPDGAIPTLSDVFVLRPFEFDGSSSRAVDGIADDSSNVGGPDTSSTYALQSAEFALFSPGPDRSFNKRIRFDEEEFNRDNITVTGP